MANGKQTVPCLTYGNSRMRGGGVDAVDAAESHPRSRERASLVAILSPRFVEIGAVRIEVFLSSSGGPLVCTAHQYLAHSDLARSARTAPFLDALSSAGRLVSVNPRGVGRSSIATSPDDLSMNRLVDDLEAVRLELGGEPWIFAGATIAGMVGLQYALRHPRALTGLIVSGGRLAGGSSRSHLPSTTRSTRGAPPSTRPRHSCTTRRRPPPIDATGRTSSLS